MSAKSCSISRVIASVVILMALFLSTSSWLAKQPSTASAAAPELNFAWAKTWNHEVTPNSSPVNAFDVGIGIIPATSGVEVYGYAEAANNNLDTNPFITSFAPNGAQLWDSPLGLLPGRLNGVAETGEMRYLWGNLGYSYWLTYYSNPYFGFPQNIGTSSSNGGEDVLGLTAHGGYAYVTSDYNSIWRGNGFIEKWTHEIHLKKYEQAIIGGFSTVDLVWNKVLTPEVAGILAADNTGLYILGGPVFDYDINAPSNDNDPKSITKFDFDGNLIWNKSLGENTATTHFGYYSLAVESDGLYLAGVTYGINPDNSQEPSDILVTKLDLAGDILWSKSYDANTPGLPKWLPEIDVGASGIYVAANLATSPDYTLDTDLIVMKLGFDGSLLATDQWGQDDDENMKAVVAVGDAFYITGYTLSGNPPGGADAFLLKYHGSNLPPVVDAGGPYSGDEGSHISLNAATTSDPDGDSLTIDWSVDSNLCTFSDPNILNPDIVCDDQGVYTVTLTADDGIYGPVSSAAVLTVNNVAPSGTFNAPTEVNEGDDILLSLTGPFDPSSADTSAGFQYAFDCGDGGGFSSFGAANSMVCPTNDNDMRTVKSRLRDKDGGETEYSANVSLNNVAPSVGPIFLDQALVEVDTTINATAVFTDPGILDTHVAIWDWGDEQSDIVPTNSPTSASHTYSAPGIYTIQVQVTDDDGDSGNSKFEYVVVYDPEGGFVTGGGWIWSPAGAYQPDPDLEGKANFGFVSKYKKGASVPTGNTEFQFKAGDLNFHSNNYDWLVVTGSDYARFKGTGTINGEGEYKFMIWAGDGEPDTFRIKIWYEEGGEEMVVYDNGMDQAIGGGNIVVH